MELRRLDLAEDAKPKTRSSASSIIGAALSHTIVWRELQIVTNRSEEFCSNDQGVYIILHRQGRIKLLDDISRPPAGATQLGNTAISSYLTRYLSLCV